MTMPIHKTLCVALATSVLGLLVGCGRATASDGLRAGLDEQDLSTLAAPEPGATAADYRVREHALRLYGTQGSGAGLTATLADTDTWRVRTVRAGDVLGRNLKVISIGPGSVQLGQGSRLITLKPRQEAQVREIRHRYDDAAIDQGRHRWSVDAASLRGVSATYGLGADEQTVQAFGRAMLRVTHVDPKGAAGHLGLQNGDLLAQLDGSPAQPGDLARLVDRALSGRVVAATVLRQAQPLPLRYEPR